MINRGQQPFPDDDLSIVPVFEQEKVDLSWYLESLWTLVWAGGLIPDLPIPEPVGDGLASLLPNLQAGETGAPDHT